MRSQTESSQLGPCWFYTSILLVTAGLVLPALSEVGLRCHFCPLVHKSQSCHNFTIHCLPDERCSTSRGFYGSRHIMSAQGCLRPHLCGSHEIVTYRGFPYKLRHTCCCKDECNVSTKSYSLLKTLLVLLKEAFALLEPRNSCANYTSSRTTTLPVTES